MGFGAPYRDRIDHDRNILIYEGHNVHRAAGVDPKKLDRPMTTPRGGLTENGRFVPRGAATDYMSDLTYDGDKRGLVCRVSGSG